MRSQEQFDQTASPQSMKTQGASQGGSSSVKGKLLSLEETIRGLTEQLNSHKSEVLGLQAEKNALEQALSEKLANARKGVLSEMGRVEEEMKRQFGQQKTEHGRLQQQINQLKGEKTGLQQELLALQRRIGELESQVGEDN